MCRWLAYSGPSLRLSDVLTRPNHSLIDQSRHATQNVESLNGDGFGVGWYGDDPTPGVYRDTHPAWNDTNFLHLAEHIHSGLFLSHVRASTGTPVQNTNCHPFNYQNWLFQHNGSIPEFHSLKRQLLFDVDPGLFLAIEGSTDSELLFYLALTFGLKDDAPQALARTIGHVEQARQAAGIEGAIYFSACVSDGERIWAVRYSSHSQSRTLYHSSHLRALHDLDGTYASLPDEAVIVVSEPLDDLTHHWKEVPESSILTVESGVATVTAFQPEII
ncbi:class II glutamine amidotransferase [Gimesia sp.]|uniref:class II glutamine amidotransferase n=1 Tax=Gimesia sp. TaxID=2024833 RepID=UPI000C5DDECA|nr:class II glutamine amidotransferase [Gimesia sp.]MAX39789.1 class II glutamine amidotransferase [Gimesia sp.]HAH46981.1 class II glutamine amidotransferase [Planctomycetaceae bacterium]HBL42452.1 class II glutamine amidotransferase [Planctomycetaceae bacterium]|tara:strand:- start:53347 stop:54168 length:822 start_codon:yes stop_codon:yes gene_type:complete